jgi:hypothetical protein
VRLDAEQVDDSSGTRLIRARHDDATQPAQETLGTAEHAHQDAACDAHRRLISPSRGAFGHLTIAYQGDVSWYVAIEPLFGPPDQRSTFYDQGALYRMGGQMFTPLHTVGFAGHGGV